MRVRCSSMQPKGARSRYRRRILDFAICREGLCNIVQAQESNRGTIHVWCQYVD